MSNPYESPQTQAIDVSKADWHTQTPLDQSAAAAAVEEFFLAEKYRLESGTKNDAIYGIGNDFLRILLGAFAKRYKFKVKVVQAGDGSTVFIDKGMSGAMGGAIGYSKMKKELARVREGLENALR